VFLDQNQAVHPSLKKPLKNSTLQRDLIKELQTILDKYVSLFFFRLNADNCQTKYVLLFSPCQVLKTGLVTQASGSAYIEVGKTKIACAVYGPRQLKKAAFSRNGTLNCEFKFSTFSCQKKRGHIKVKYTLE
jgi:hypothetical protein